MVDQLKLFTTSYLPEAKWSEIGIGIGNKKTHMDDNEEGKVVVRISLSHTKVKCLAQNFVDFEKISSSKAILDKLISISFLQIKQFLTIKLSACVS